MKINVDLIKALSSQLATIGAMLSPQTGAAIATVEALVKLFSVGTQFNGLLKDVMEQTDATADEVMAAVIADYAASSSALQAAMAAKTPAP